MGRFAVISLTDKAASRVREIVDTRDNAKGIRLGVKKGGCAGMEYTVDLVTEPNPKDDHVERDGAHVLWRRRRLCSCSEPRWISIRRSSGPASLSAIRTRVRPAAAGNRWNSSPPTSRRWRKRALQPEKSAPGKLTNSAARTSVPACAGCRGSGAQVPAMRRFALPGKGLHFPRSASICRDIPHTDFGVCPGEIRLRPPVAKGESSSRRVSVEANRKGT